MIPYIEPFLFEIEDIPLCGDLPIGWFGILVATGVLLGSLIAEKQGQKMGLDRQDMRWLSTRVVIGGFIISHVFDMVAYNPETILEDPMKLLYFWAGLSSFGGFLGAFLTFVWLTRREKLPALPFADAICLGLAPAWIFGRLGCFTAHDHPGLETDFFLAVAYPEGPRHDLGLYEAIVTVFITIALYRYARTRRGPGAIAGLACVLYAPPRFLLDFLRATDVAHADPRYGGLTPGQWASIACLALGIHLLRQARGKPPYAAPAPEAGQTPGDQEPSISSVSAVSASAEDGDGVGT